MRRNFSSGSFGTDDDNFGGGDRVRYDRVVRRTSSNGSISGDSEGYWGPPTIGSAAARERGRSVKVEFVYADGGEREVCLCGSWNEWSPTQMHKEGDNVWSVVVLVQSGYQEFCYLVDGQYAVSSRHPVTDDGACNWRTVHGPPRRRRRGVGQRLIQASKSIGNTIGNTVSSAIDTTVGSTMQILHYVRGRRQIGTMADKHDEESHTLIGSNIINQLRDMLGPLKYFGAAMLIYITIYCILVRSLHSSKT